MKKSDWLGIGAFFLLPLILDQGLKFLTKDLGTAPVLMGVFSVFSSFSDLDAVPLSLSLNFQKINSIAFFLFSVFLIQFLWAANIFFYEKKIYIRLILSVFFGSLLSIAADQILFSKTINNLAFTFQKNHFYPFNLAVLTAFVSLTILIYELIIKRKEILNTKNIRTIFLLKNKDQTQFLIYILIGFTVVYFFIFFIFIIYLKFLESDLNFSLPLGASFYLMAFLSYAVCFFLVFTLSFLFSHRIYGPAQGFYNYMRGLFEKEGKKEIDFKTRKKDHFKELEKIAEYIRTRLMKKL